MSSGKLLTDHVAPSVVKVLLSYGFGAGIATIGGSIFDFLRSKLNDRRAAKQAADQVQRIAAASIAPLIPVFEAEARRNLNPRAVATALADTLEQHVDGKFLLRHDLNPEKVHAALLAVRPLEKLEKQAYGEAEVRLYARALPKLLREVVCKAPQLDGFDVASPSEILNRLTRIERDSSLVREGIEHLVGAETERTKTESSAREEFKKSYADAVLERWNKLELFGIDVSSEVQRRQELSVAYIPLNLHSGERAGASAESPGHLVSFAGLLDRAT